MNALDKVLGLLFVANRFESITAEVSWDIGKIQLEVEISPFTQGLRDVLKRTEDVFQNGFGARPDFHGSGHAR